MKKDFKNSLRHTACILPKRSNHLLILADLRPLEIPYSNQSHNSLELEPSRRNMTFMWKK